MNYINFSIHKGDKFAIAGSDGYITFFFKEFDGISIIHTYKALN